MYVNEYTTIFGRLKDSLNAAAYVNEYQNQASLDNTPATPDYRTYMTRSLISRGFLYQNSKNIEDLYKLSLEKLFNEEFKNMFLYDLQRNISGVYNSVSDIKKMGPIGIYDLFSHLVGGISAKYLPVIDPNISFTEEELQNLYFADPTYEQIIEIMNKRPNISTDEYPEIKYRPITDEERSKGPIEDEEYYAKILPEQKVSYVELTKEEIEDGPIDGVDYYSYGLKEEKEYVKFDKEEYSDEKFVHYEKVTEKNGHELYTYKINNINRYVETKDMVPDPNKKYFHYKINEIIYEYRPIAEEDRDQYINSDEQLYIRTDDGKFVKVEDKSTITDSDNICYKTDNIFGYIWDDTEFVEAFIGDHGFDPYLTYFEEQTIEEVDKTKYVLVENEDDVDFEKYEYFNKMYIKGPMDYYYIKDNNYVLVEGDYLYSDSTYYRAIISSSVDETKYVKIDSFDDVDVLLGMNKIFKEVIETIGKESYVKTSELEEFNDNIQYYVIDYNRDLLTQDEIAEYVKEKIIDNVNRQFMYQIREFLTTIKEAFSKYDLYTIQKSFNFEADSYMKHIVRVLNVKSLNIFASLAYTVGLSDVLDDEKCIPYQFIKKVISVSMGKSNVVGDTISSSYFNEFITNFISFNLIKLVDFHYKIKSPFADNVDVGNVNIPVNQLTMTFTENLVTLRTLLEKTNLVTDTNSVLGLTLMGYNMFIQLFYNSAYLSQYKTPVIKTVKELMKYINEDCEFVINSKTLKKYLRLEDTTDCM